MTSVDPTLNLFGRRRIVSAFAILLSFGWAGCTRASRDAGFGSVESVVLERLGQRVYWNQGREADRAIAEAIELLLQGELSVEAAVQTALLNNRRLQEIYEELGFAQADLVEAGLLSNPVFGGIARSPESGIKGTNIELEIAQEFINILMMPGRKRIAEAQFEKTKLRVTAEVMHFATQTRVKFYELQAAEQISQVLRTITEAANASSDFAQRVHEAGNLSDLELANEKALFEQARIELAMSEADAMTAREDLNRLMGLWGAQTQWSIAPGLPAIPDEEMPLEDLESIAIEKRLDLAAAGKELEAIAEGLGLTRNWRWLMFADLGVSAEQELDGSWVVGPSLSFEIPLFNRRQADIARLESALRQSEHRLTALAVEIRSEVRSLRNQMLFARDLAQHYRTVLIPLREEIVGLSLEQYNFMLIGIFEVLLAKQEEMDAYKEYVHAVRDYWIARSELERAIGGSISEVPTESLISPIKPIMPPSMDHSAHSGGVDK